MLVVQGQSTTQLLKDTINIRIDFDSAQSIIGVNNTQNISLNPNNKPCVLEAFNRYQIIYSVSGQYSIQTIVDDKPTKTICTTDLPLQLTGSVYINNNWYRDTVIINQTSLGIVAINTIKIQNLLPSMIGNLSDEYSSYEAIKGASILFRSALYCMNYINKTKELDYDLIDSDIHYKGITNEQQHTNDLIKQTKDYVLLDKYGNIICSKLQSATTSNSFPFEYLGSNTDAWEQIYTFEDIKIILRQSGYQFSELLSIREEVIPNNQTNNITIIITTPTETLKFTPEEIQVLLGLPSAFFKFYTLPPSTKNNIPRLQILGSLAGYNQKSQQRSSILNIIDVLEDSREYNGESYQSILERLYPDSYLF